MRDREQLHNPYAATPLSVAAYKLNMSPSDREKIDAVTWLEKLQSSVQSAGTSKGLESFSLESRVWQEADDEEEEEGAGVEGPAERPIQSLNQILEDQVPLKDANDKLQSLPDDAVPLGLLANLSISSNRTKKGRQSTSQEKENTDDDDVVSFLMSPPFESS